MYHPTHDQEPLRLEVVRHHTQVPMAATLGIEYFYDDGLPRARLPFADRVRDQDGRAHRGALMMLADQIAGSALVAKVGTHIGAATMNLRMDWLAAAAPAAAILAIVRRIVHDGESALVEVDLHSEGAPERIATALGQFRVGSLPGGRRGPIQLYSGQDLEMRPFDAAGFDVYLALQGEKTRFLLPSEARLIGSHLPSFHGGAIIAALHESAWRHAGDGNQVRPVTSNAIFLRPALATTPIHIDVETVRAGRSMSLVRATGWQERPDRVVALGDLLLLNVQSVGNEHPASTWQTWSA